MNALDASIVGVFLVYVLVAGLADRRRASGGLDQYFLAGRSLGGWQAGISMAATQFAADTPLLVTGLVAVGGIFALWRLWIYALAFLLLAFVLAGCWRRTGVLTDAEFAELRYAGGAAAGLRLFKALYFGTLFNCVVLAIVLLATTRIVEPFLLWNEWLPARAHGVVEAIARPWAAALTATPATDPAFGTRAGNNLLSLLLVALVTLTYSTLGGLRSVVRTDIVQFVLMLAATLVYAALIVGELGGLTAMVDQLRSAFPAAGERISAAQLLAFTPDAARDVSGVLLAVFALQWLIQLNADGSGYLAQRTMACRNDREARRAGVVFTFLQVVVRSLLWLPIALGLLLLFPAPPELTGTALIAEREATYVLGIVELLPPGVKGLLLTAMLAALASTLDTHLNWGAAYWTNDIYARFIAPRRGRAPEPRTLVRVARASNLLLLALSFAVMTQLDSIRTAWEASLLLGAGVGIVLVLRWIWWRLNAWGEVGALLASALLVPAALALVPEGNALARLLVVALGATTVAVFASLRIAPARPAALVAFYRQVQPPGFWGPVAQRAGEDARAPLGRLARGLGAMLACAVTVFGLLIGLGSWLVEATPLGWLPHRGAWIALCLGAALAATPLWWRALGAK